MRAAVALLCALLVLAAATVAHHHAGADGGQACSACTLRAAEEAGPAAPDLTPRPAVAAHVEALPAGRSPVGAPMGAIPGQSPPAA